MQLPEFDEDRDCSQDGIVQDIAIEHVGGYMSVMQQDGANETCHVVLIPMRKLNEFINTAKYLSEGREGDRCTIHTLR